MLRLPLAIDATCGDVLRVLRDEPMPFALTGRWAGGGALVGASPVRVVRGEAAIAALDDARPGVAGGGGGLDEPPAFVGGGWFGYLGFGLGAAIERLPPAPPRPVPLEAAVLGFYDHMIRRDAAGRWWFEALRDDAAARARHAELERRLAGPAFRAPRPWRLEGMTLRGPGADGHRAAVAECVERIAAGELFQANVCLRLDGRWHGSAADAYAGAAERLRPAYGAFLGLPDGAALVSLSPELFLRRRGREVETGPIKGTVPRSADAAAAARERAALAGSVKDAAEHVMIVDLMRNDLGRVAEYGTVFAPDRPDVEPHPGLWHLVTRVRARLRDGVGDADLVRATFPPGSVTGAPKVQALKVISELEATAREAYTGAIGFVSPHAGLELNVAIRTLEIRGDRAWLGAGGGVVADSDPDAELQEALAKARPIVEALGASVPEVTTPASFSVPVHATASSTPGSSAGASSSAEAGAGSAGNLPVSGGSRAPGPRVGAGLRRIARPDPARGLLETILVRDGRPVDLEMHLARLGASAAELYDVGLPAELNARIRAAAALAGTGSARLRVIFDPSGQAEVGVQPAGAARRARDASAPQAASEPQPVRLEPVLAAGGLGAHKWADRQPTADLDRPGHAGLICDLDGAVLEASSANVWALIDGELVTPPADGRILPGTTRARALALGHLDGTPLAERPLSLDDVRAADALIVTSAIRLAAPAALAGDEPTARAAALARALRRALDTRIASDGGPVAQVVRAADS